MQSFSLTQDTIGYTCSCLSKIEDPSTRADQRYVKQAKKLRSELQTMASSVAKTSNVSVLSETISELFSFTTSILTDKPLPSIVFESLLILTYFVLREAVNVGKFDIRTLRMSEPVTDENGKPPKNFSTYLAIVIWHLFNSPQPELNKDQTIKQLISLAENLCVCEVGLSGPSYINMCKILLGLAYSKTYAPYASLSFYHATLSLNKHLSSSRTSTILSEEYVTTLSSYLKFLLKVLQFFSDESSTLLLPAGSAGTSLFRLAFGGSAADGGGSQGSSAASGDVGFSSRFFEVLGLTYNSTLFQAVAHEELRRITIAAMYLLFYFSNYFYLEPEILKVVSEDLLIIVPNRFIVTHSTQPVIVTVAFALMELVLRIYCFHIPARCIKAYFENVIFKILEEPDVPCGELKLGILAHIGRIFSGDVLNSTFIFGVSELESFAFKYSYPTYELLDVNDYEYIKLLFPRPFNYIFNLFITFDCDFESSDLIYRLVSVVAEYTNSSSPGKKFSSQKYMVAQLQSGDGQNVSYQVPTMAYSFQISVHKFFFHLISRYLHRYDPSFASPVTTTSILAQDHTYLATKNTIADSTGPTERRKSAITLQESEQFVPNLIMYAHYLGVNVYNISKSFNYLSPATCLLTNCTEAAIYALSRIAYSISYWSYLHQCDSITEQSIPLEKSPAGSGKAMGKHAELFSYMQNRYNITELMKDHNKKRLFDKGYLLFDRKMKKGIDYFVSNNKITKLIPLESPTPLSLPEPVTGRKRTFDEDWYFSVYSMEKHMASFKNASEHYKSVAQFLIDNVTENTFTKIGIPQDVVGEIIGGADSPNYCTLYEYVMIFSEKWNNLSRSTNSSIRLNSNGQLPVEEALRDILSCFKLPGEGQVIARIMTYISYAYVKADTAVIKHHQICNGLMFAIVMLNTDLHNKAIKTQRMTKSTFFKNTKYIDTDDLLTRELLDSIYDNIAANPFSLGSIDTKREIFDLMDKYFKAPGGAKTISNGVSIKANAPTPGSKDTTLNMIAHGHQYYPYLATACMREWIDVDLPLESPRKSIKSVSLDADLNRTSDATYTPTMIAKLAEKYHFAFFESLLLKLDASVHLELLRTLTQIPAVSEQSFLLCLRPFFTLLSLLHCDFFRQTRPICRTVVDELIQLTNIKSLSVLSINPNNYTPGTSREHSTSHTDSKFDRALSSLEVSRAKSTSVCYVVTVIHAALEFIYILSNLEKTKTPTSNPLTIEPYSRTDLTGEPLFLSFANHFENKTSLLSNMYMGKLSGGDCWDLYLQIFACIEYYLDAADRNKFPQLDRGELLKIFNIDTYKSDVSLTVSNKKFLITSMVAQSHRIDFDIQCIQRCLDFGDNGDEEMEWDDAALIYYIYNLLDKRLLENTYTRFMNFSSRSLTDLFRAFVSCSAQALAAINGTMYNDKERSTYYLKRGLQVLEGVAKNSLDRLKRTFSEIQPIISDAYSNPDEEIVTLCLGCHQSVIRTYFAKFKQHSSISTQPSKTLEIPQLKTQHSRSRSRIKSLKVPPKAPLLDDSIASDTSSVASSNVSLSDSSFQRVLMKPLIYLIEKTGYIQIIDLVLNFLEELQLLYSVSSSFYTAPSTIEDIARVVEITVTRISLRRDTACSSINSLQSDEAFPHHDPSTILTDSLDLRTESSSLVTPPIPGTRGSVSPCRSPLEPLVQLPQSVEDELSRLSLLIGRCDSISKRILDLLETQKTLISACVRMSYALSQQQIDSSIATSSMATFTKLIYLSYDYMICSISQADPTAASLASCDSERTDNLTALSATDPYANSFISTVKILSELSMDNAEAARRISTNLLREFVTKLMGDQLTSYKQSKVAPAIILKEILVKSLLPSVCEKTKAEPRLSLCACNVSSLYVMTNHGFGKRIPILKYLWKIRQRTGPILTMENTRLHLCEESGCGHHTVVDTLLDYVLDQRMSNVICEVILYGLESIIFTTGSRAMLTFYKILTSYLCDILSILMEEQAQGHPNAHVEAKVVHGMGYSNPAQVMKFMTSIVDAVEMWVENTKARSQTGGDKGSIGGLSGSYMDVYDYISHLTNTYARLYEYLGKLTQSVELSQLHELIFRMIKTIELIQKNRFSGADDENNLLVGLFIAGSRMNGDSIIDQIVLNKIVEVLQVYADLLEKAETSQSRAHEGMVIVAGAALTSLANLQLEQIASQRTTLFNLCINLIVSNSREIRIKIAVAMKALFLQ
ncbi:Sec7-like guanine nucleotide exchange factor [Giardia duodenalis assemblage B]|uniref:Sec7-like guanine nucleotide exchange factor n=1 Tax=Giardia duodenalis assemblage B TaxID=1394984 RepID=A0A132NZU4_GIAIN|nr:Sec7-like guanine nucleotide exchange factor [Giardia intestinalis assemblage B]